MNPVIRDMIIEAIETQAKRELVRQIEEELDNSGMDVDICWERRHPNAVYGQEEGLWIIDREDNDMSFVGEDVSIGDIERLLVAARQEDYPGWAYIIGDMIDKLPA